MKRLCLLLVVLLPLGALGEEPALTAEELAEIAALDAVEDVTGEAFGPVWEESTMADRRPRCCTWAPRGPSSAWTGLPDTSSAGGFTA